MRKLYSNLNSLNVVSKLMTVLILKFDRDVHLRTQREAQSLVHILGCQVENVSN